MQIRNALTEFLEDIAPTMPGLFSTPCHKGTVIAVVLTAIPGLASAGISLAFFMAVALFFPSRRVRSLSRRKMRGTLMTYNPETIVTDYYCK